MTGTIDGVQFETGSVTNSGTIKGISRIQAGNLANVINSRAITGGDAGIVALTNAKVANSGTISGSANTSTGIHAGSAANIAGRCGLRVVCSAAGQRPSRRAWAMNTIADCVSKRR